MSWSHRLASLGLVAFIALAGCDAGDAGADDEAAANPEGAAERRDAAGDDEPRVELAPINQSGITGEAAFDRDGDQLTVNVSLEGLEPGAQYPAHLHDGRCAAGGPVRLPLGDVTAGEDGAGSLRMRLSGERVQAGEAVFVQVHGTDGQPVACADLGDDDGGETERDGEAAPGAAGESGASTG
jgi:hypothetical protein